MNREEYIAELRRNLHELPADEQESAIQYYIDYFEDAGVENEQEVIDRLGSPAKVAQTIISDYRGNQANGDTQGQPPRSGDGNKLLLIILAVISSPIWLPIALGLGAALLALFIAGFAVFGALGIVSVVLFTTGVIVFGSGFFTIGLGIPTAVFSAGSGFIMAGVGLLLGVTTIWMCVKVLPALIRLFVKLCSLPFNRRRV